MLEYKKRIGEFLVDRGKIDQQALDEALEIQKQSGAKIGEILQSQGKISAYKFYIELADFLGHPFVDLEKYDISRKAMDANKRDDYFANDYLPFDIDTDGTVFVATTNPTPQLTLHLGRHYEKYKIYVTSPFDILWTLQKFFVHEDDEDAKTTIQSDMAILSAKSITLSKKAIQAIIIIGLFAFLVLQNHFMLKVFLLCVNIFFLATLLSKTLFFIKGAFIKKADTTFEATSISPAALPFYTILVPLYREKPETLRQITGAIKALNYPLAKLDVKLITELDDTATIESLKALSLESNFQIIRVPHSIPKTKPKACNYALRFAKGEYVTIYDAEDIPDQNQLRKTFLAFQKTEDASTALQCHLNFYNRDENLLTKFFSIEYASWFENMLYGLQALKLPIPLGGTSNHFRTSFLKNIRAWDAYNVTEDAELGMRITLSGGNVKVVNSTTIEECPNQLKNWLHQRTRWIKGYIQTFAAYMAAPKQVIKNFGFRRFMGFFFFIGAPFMSYILAPIAFLLWVTTLISSPDFADLTYFLYFNFIFGLALHLFIAILVCLKNKWVNLLPVALFFPIYWVLHSIASYIAIYEFVKKPHHWNKTEHGVSKIKPVIN